MCLRDLWYGESFGFLLDAAELVSLFADGADIFPAAFQKPALNFTRGFLSSEEDCEPTDLTVVLVLFQETGVLEIT